MDHNNHMRECLENCRDCHAVCLQTVQHCLQIGGPHAEASHIGLLLDCSQICETSADFMLRGSPRHGLTCSVCADICASCADDCARLAQNDPMMEKCAEVCRRCADSCQRMARAKAA